MSKRLIYENTLTKSQYMIRYICKMADNIICDMASYQVTFTSCRVSCPIQFSIDLLVIQVANICNMYMLLWKSRQFRQNVYLHEIIKQPFSQNNNLRSQLYNLVQIFLTIACFVFREKISKIRSVTSNNNKTSVISIVRYLIVNHR